MEGYLKPIKITKKVSLGAGEKKVVELTSEDFPSLLIKNPYLWYPNGYGEQYLHHIKLSYNTGGKVSDTKEFDFGIREVEVGLNRVEVDGDKAEVEYGRVYYVNGKRVFCKGGWIQPDILLEESDKYTVTYENMGHYGFQYMDGNTDFDILKVNITEETGND